MIERGALESGVLFSFSSNCEKELGDEGASMLSTGNFPTTDKLEKAIAELQLAQSTIAFRTLLVTHSKARSLRCAYAVFTSTWSPSIMASYEVSGSVAGPSVASPSALNLEPWQGQANSDPSQATPQPW